MTIYQLINDNGNAAANQFVIIDSENKTIYFQSYNTIIAKVNTNGKNVVLSKDWCHSTTTSKHLYMFLRNNTKYYINEKKDVVHYLKSGEFSLVEKISLV